MSSKKQRLEITQRSLYARIARKLAKDGKQLRTARSAAMESNVGRYYIIDTYRNEVVDYRLDLITLGKDLGLLQPWEEVAVE
jgi:hypothetical protein